MSTAHSTCMVCEVMHVCEREPTMYIEYFYKAIHNLTALPILDYFLHVTRSTQNYHSLHYVIPSSNSDSYKFSFFHQSSKLTNFFN